MKRYIKSAILNISDEHPDTRFDIAVDEDTDWELLKDLIHDSDSWVRGAAFHNPNIPIPVLVEYSNYSDPAIMINIALNPNTPSNILNRYSYSANSQIRINVAMNPNSSTETLQRLTTDRDWMVREKAEKQLMDRGVIL